MKIFNSCIDCCDETRLVCHSLSRLHMNLIWFFYEWHKLKKICLILWSFESNLIHEVSDHEISTNCKNRYTDRFVYEISDHFRSEHRKVFILRVNWEENLWIAIEFYLSNKWCSWKICSWVLNEYCSFIYSISYNPWNKWSCCANASCYISKIIFSTSF